MAAKASATTKIILPVTENLLSSCYLAIHVVIGGPRFIQLLAHFTKLYGEISDDPSHKAVNEYIVTSSVRADIVQICPIKTSKTDVSHPQCFGALQLEK